jgi:RNA polymerase sigma-70 factor (ECF subfamily)
MMRAWVEGFGRDGGTDRLARDVAEHVTALRRYALVLVGDPGEADDLVRECLGRGLARMRGWRPVRDLRAHLFAALHDAFVDSTRRRKVRRSDVPLEQVVSSLSRPADRIERLELGDLVAALHRLPAQQREAVLLIGLEGMSYEEAADVLGAKVGTVKSRLCRGREALRRLMDGEVGEDGITRLPGRPLTPATSREMAAVVLAFQRSAAAAARTVHAGAEVVDLAERRTGT